ncbi:MAG: hypothetical protein U0Q15_09340 [Kineosporiaceae bacterium]
MSPMTCTLAATDSTDATAVVAELFASAGLDDLFAEVLASAATESDALDAPRLSDRGATRLTWICWKTTGLADTDRAAA